MQFNGSATSQDCVSEILKICGATTNTYPLVDITRRFNFALDRYFSLAFSSDARWSLDDLNQTAPPLESINLVSGTNKYALDTFTSEIINVLRVEALDSNGNAILLKPFDDTSVRNSALTNLFSSSGTPSWYRKFGKWIYLYPTPSYNSTNGLSLYFERPESRMASTDTTKVPGVPSIHHMCLCRAAALPFLIEKKLPQASNVAQQVALDEEMIIDHFSHRDKDVPMQISVRKYGSR
jgi:hypothetical protein